MPSIARLLKAAYMGKMSKEEVGAPGGGGRVALIPEDT